MLWIKVGNKICTLQHGHYFYQEGIVYANDQI